MPTAVIVQDTRFKKEDNTFALKLRITNKSIQNYYPVIIENNKIGFSKSDWSKIEKPRPRGDLGEWKEKLQKYEKKAREIIAELQIFSFEAFKDKYYSGRSEGNDLRLGFNNYLARLKEEGRTGTYNAYNDSKRSIEKFRKNIKYSDIDKYWLRAYVQHMKNVRNNSSTTQGIYISALRVILRAEGRIYIKSDPFDGFVMPRGKKRTHYYLTESEVRAFAKYEPVDENETMAQAFWMFSFRCNGINFKDIAYLKWDDISEDEIVLARQKTKGRTSKEIYIPLTGKVKKHIEIFGNPRNRKFIFEIISIKDSPERADKKIALFIGLMNEYTSRIGQKLQFKIKVTSTVARHSFATVLYRAGNNLVDIRDALGHSSIQTTENYIGSLGFGDRDKLKRLDI